MITTSLRRGGAETQAVSLAAELRRRGWNVKLISLVSGCEFKEEPCSSLGMQPGFANPLGLLRLVAMLRSFRPQVLHAHLFHANVLARLARLVCPVPVVISTLHSVAESAQRHGTILRRDLVYRITDPLADIVVAVSQAVAERHAKAGAAARRKLTVIPNGVDTGLFRPDAERRLATRRELGLQSEFVWLAAGRLMWKKGYPTLLRAFGQRRNSVLLIAGEGPQVQELRALAKEVAAPVRFLGRRDDMPSLMNAADACVLSSAIEGLPMILIEAASSGLPCVSTDVGGAPDAIVEGETGFLVAPGNVPALSEALLRLEALPESELHAFGQQARARAIARFDLRTVAGQWEEQYRKLLD
jgi:glycosyltransferase involved in cell wall biosynthesis